MKKEVADVVIAALEPVQQRYTDLIADKQYLESVLKDGAAQAQKRAYKILGKVYRKAGFVERPLVASALKRVLIVSPCRLCLKPTDHRSAQP